MGSSSIFFSSSDGECSRVLDQFVARGNADCSDSSNAPCGLLQLVQPVRTSFASTFSTITSPIAQFEAACTARSLVVQAHVAVLNQAGLETDIQTSSEVPVKVSSSFLRDLWKIVLVGYSE